MTNDKKINHHVLFLVLAAWVGLTLCSAGSAGAGDTHWILQWTADQIGFNRPVEPPAVRWVDKDTLTKLFCQRNDASIQRWHRRWGPAKAQRILASYLEQVIGLYDPQTDTVYVGWFLDQCEQQAILAHEMTHYLQDLRDGPVDPDAYGADELHMLREIEAYRVQETFSKRFCPQKGSRTSRR